MVLNKYKNKTASLLIVHKSPRTILKTNTAIDFVEYRRG
jgi:hypothetical protein